MDTPNSAPSLGIASEVVDGLNFFGFPVRLAPGQPRGCEEACCPSEAHWLKKWRAHGNSNAS